MGNKESIKQALKSPNRKVYIRKTIRGLFDSAMPGGIIFEETAGLVYVRVERDAQLNTKFIHSAPGTGTRIAIVDCTPLEGIETAFFMLKWTTEAITLRVADASDNSLFVEAEGKPSGCEFRVGTDGMVIEIGHGGGEVKELNIYEGGKLILRPTAIQAWGNTKEAVGLLLKAILLDDKRIEVITSNLALVMLVTGFETYCERRFSEIELEGIEPDFGSLIKAFSSKYERESGIKDALSDEARERAISPIGVLIGRRRINFQDYDQCKKAFNKGYDIKFGKDLGIPNAILDEVKRLINFRHKVVHISPMSGVLNMEKSPTEELVFSNKAFAEKAVSLFTDFIKALHQSTLRLTN